MMIEDPGVIDPENIRSTPLYLSGSEEDLPRIEAVWLDGVFQLDWLDRDSALPDGGMSYPSYLIDYRKREALQELLRTKQPKQLVLYEQDFDDKASELSCHLTQEEELLFRLSRTRAGVVEELREHLISAAEAQGLLDFLDRMENPEPGPGVPIFGL